MPIDRRALKLRSQELIRTATPKPIFAGLIILALSVVMGILSSRIISLNATEAELLQYLEYVENGNLEYAVNMLDSIQPSPSAYLMNFALQLVSDIVSVGFIIFLMNTIRNTAACYGNLLDGFGFFLRIIWLNILESFFIGLWSLLLIVPGVVASYRYRQAVYIMIDHPEMSALQCIRESKRLMSGRKGELFALDLSFIGWSLLGGLPFLGYLVQVWTIPYMNLSYALYYEVLVTGIPEQFRFGSANNAPPF